MKEENQRKNFRAELLLFLTRMERELPICGAADQENIFSPFSRFSKVSCEILPTNNVVGQLGGERDCF